MFVTNRKQVAILLCLVLGDPSGFTEILKITKVSPAARKAHDHICTPMHVQQTHTTFH